MENSSGCFDSPTGYIKSLVEQFRSTGTLPPGIDREDILSIDIDPHQWYRLETELGLGETDKFPKFFYDPLVSRLSVEWMALPLHELVVEIFSSGLYDATRHIKSKCSIRTNEQFQQHKDNNYVTTLKAPDLALLSGKKVLILEVGFSQTYEQLVDTAKFWLEGSLDVTRVVIVKITEPKYSCPLKNAGISMLQSLGFPTDDWDIESQFCLESGFGPVTLGTTKWVGEINMFLEHVCEATPPTLPLSLSDFLEVDADDNRNIVIDWEEFHGKLKEDLLKTAILRYQDMLDRCYGREENVCRVKETPSRE
ncbi:predicted protein [Uncinocarpus reesii 1704]|uniref:Uncharacterized protein n=1 Tax=Uncinocarpus reesii (strain UAMH 1704) TaxID=336963 RepID=C4JNU4_UNCRE|nr:uncharacterized protein UREG_04414 [Uncinocarpus reesii 1704]EEP79568.1 predicted protein [Uncinocarpus reesii 1704]